MKRNIKENNPAGPITYKTEAFDSHLAMRREERNLPPGVDSAGVAVFFGVGNNL